VNVITMIKKMSNTIFTCPYFVKYMCKVYVTIGKKIANRLVGRVQVKQIKSNMRTYCYLHPIYILATTYLGDLQLITYRYLPI
jgi:hypothetical protein